MVSEIAGSAFLSDSIIFLRSILRSNITDPLDRAGAGSPFVYSSYSKENIKYPIITVKDAGASDIRRLGMRSTAMAMSLPYEIRVWARNVKERDYLAQEVYTFMKGNQFGAGSKFENVEMHDVLMTSMVNVDEPGEEGIKSKVIEYKSLFINK